MGVLKMSRGCRGERGMYLGLGFTFLLSENSGKGERGGSEMRLLNLLRDRGDLSQVASRVVQVRPECELWMKGCRVGSLVRVVDGPGDKRSIQSCWLSDKVFEEASIASVSSCLSDEVFKEASIASVSGRGSAERIAEGLLEESQEQPAASGQSKSHDGML